MKLLTKTKDTQADGRADRLAAKIAGSLLSGQHKLSDRLNSLTAGLTPRQQLIYLLLFCLAFGAASGYIISEAVTRPGARRLSVPAGHVGPHIGLPSYSLKHHNKSYQK